MSCNLLLLHAELQRLGLMALRRCLVLSLLFIALHPRLSSSSEIHSIIDMAGRNVILSKKITRVVTLGPVPVLNSFVFAFGKQGCILNGLPLNLRHFHHEEFFAPGLYQRPIVQGSDMSLAVEDIIALHPDVVFTMNTATASILEKCNQPVVVFARCRTSEDVKAIMALMGNIFDEPDVAQDYTAYFDEVIEKVESKITTVPNASRPRVLFAFLGRLTQPHRIANWWITKAGGRSVTDDRHHGESLTFSLEQLLAWDPEILIVGNRAEATLAYSDPRFRTLTAVRNKQVYVSPAGAMLWSNNTVELPLMLLWAACTIHPELFDKKQLRAETTAFYERFFHVHVSSVQLDEIFSGPLD